MPWNQIRGMRNAATLGYGSINIERVCSKEKISGEEQLFKLMYSLIDTEKRANSANDRKGIIDSLERYMVSSE
jgi:hypothetical protein